MPDYVTIKLYAETRRLLRLLAAQSGEQMVQVMQRLCQDEWERAQRSAADKQGLRGGERGEQKREASRTPKTRK